MKSNNNLFTLSEALADYDRKRRGASKRREYKRGSAGANRPSSALFKSDRTPKDPLGDLLADALEENDAPPKEKKNDAPPKEKKKALSEKDLFLGDSKEIFDEQDLEKLNAEYEKVKTQLIIDSNHHHLSPEDRDSLIARFKELTKKLHPGSGKMLKKDKSADKVKGTGKKEPPISAGPSQDPNSTPKKPVSTPPPQPVGGGGGGLVPNKTTTEDRIPPFPSAHVNRPLDVPRAYQPNAPVHTEGSKTTTNKDRPEPASQSAPRPNKPKVDQPSPSGQRSPPPLGGNKGPKTEGFTNALYNYAPTALGAAAAGGAAYLAGKGLYSIYQRYARNRENARKRAEVTQALEKNAATGGINPNAGGGEDGGALNNRSKLLQNPAVLEKKPPPEHNVEMPLDWGGEEEAQLSPEEDHFRKLLSRWAVYHQSEIEEEEDQKEFDKISREIVELNDQHNLNYDVTAIRKGIKGLPAAPEEAPQDAQEPPPAPNVEEAPPPAPEEAPIDVDLGDIGDMYVDGANNIVGQNPPPVLEEPKQNEPLIKREERYPGELGNARREDLPPPPPPRSEPQAQQFDDVEIVEDNGQLLEQQVRLEQPKPQPTPTPNPVQAEKKEVRPEAPLPVEDQGAGDALAQDIVNAGNAPAPAPVEQPRVVQEQQPVAQPQVQPPAPVVQEQQPVAQPQVQPVQQPVVAPQAPPVAQPQVQPPPQAAPQAPPAIEPPAPQPQSQAMVPAVPGPENRIVDLGLIHTKASREKVEESAQETLSKLTGDLVKTKKQEYQQNAAALAGIAQELEKGYNLVDVGGLKLGTYHRKLKLYNKLIRGSGAGTVDFAEVLNECSVVINRFRELAAEYINFLSKYTDVHPEFLSHIQVIETYRMSYSLNSINAFGLLLLNSITIFSRWFSSQRAEEEQSEQIQIVASKLVILHAQFEEISKQASSIIPQNNAATSAFSKVICDILAVLHNSSNRMQLGVAVSDLLRAIVRNEDSVDGHIFTREQAAYVENTRANRPILFLLQLVFGDVFWHSFGKKHQVIKDRLAQVDPESRASISLRCLLKDAIFIQAFKESAAYIVDEDNNATLPEELRLKDIENYLVGEEDKYKDNSLNLYMGILLTKSTASFTQDLALVIKDEFDNLNSLAGKLGVSSSQYSLNSADRDILNSFMDERVASLFKANTSLMGFAGAGVALPFLGFIGMAALPAVGVGALAALAWKRYQDYRLANTEAFSATGTFNPTKFGSEYKEGLEQLHHQNIVIEDNVSILSAQNLLLLYKNIYSELVFEVNENLGRDSHLLSHQLKNFVVLIEREIQLYNLLTKTIPPTSGLFSSDPLSRNTLLFCSYATLPAFYNIDVLGGGFKDKILSKMLDSVRNLDALKVLHQDVADAISFFVSDPEANFLHSRFINSLATLLKNAKYGGCELSWGSFVREYFKHKGRELTAELFVASPITFLTKISLKAGVFSGFVELSFSVYLASLLSKPHASFNFVYNEDGELTQVQDKASQKDVLLKLFRQFCVGITTNEYERLFHYTESISKLGRDALRNFINQSSITQFASKNAPFDAMQLLNLWARGYVDNHVRHNFLAFKEPPTTLFHYSAIGEQINFEDPESACYKLHYRMLIPLAFYNISIQTDILSRSRLNLQNLTFKAISGATDPVLAIENGTNEASGFSGQISTIQKGWFRDTSLSVQNLNSREVLALRRVQEVLTNKDFKDLASNYFTLKADAARIGAVTSLLCSKKISTDFNDQLVAMLNASYSDSKALKKYLINAKINKVPFHQLMLSKANQKLTNNDFDKHFEKVFIAKTEHVADKGISGFNTSSAKLVFYMSQLLIPSSEYKRSACSVMAMHLAGAGNCLPPPTVPSNLNRENDNHLYFCSFLSTKVSSSMEIGTEVLEGYVRFKDYQKNKLSSKGTDFEKSHKVFNLIEELVKREFGDLIEYLEYRLEYRGDSEDPLSALVRAVLYKIATASDEAVEPLLSCYQVVYLRYLNDPDADKNSLLDLALEILTTAATTQLVNFRLSDDAKEKDMHLPMFPYLGFVWQSVRLISLRCLKHMSNQRRFNFLKPKLERYNFLDLSIDQLKEVNIEKFFDALVLPGTEKKKRSKRYPVSFTNKSFLTFDKDNALQPQRLDFKYDGARPAGFSEIYVPVTPEKYLRNVVGDRDAFLKQVSIYSLDHKDDEFSRLMNKDGSINYAEVPFSEFLELRPFSTLPEQPPLAENNLSHEFVDLLKEDFIQTEAVTKLFTKYTQAPTEGKNHPSIHNIEAVKENVKKLDDYVNLFSTYLKVLNQNALAMNYVQEEAGLFKKFTTFIMGRSSTLFNSEKLSRTDLVNFCNFLDEQQKSSEKLLELFSQMPATTVAYFLSCIAAFKEMINSTKEISAICRRICQLTDTMSLHNLDSDLVSQANNTMLHYKKAVLEAKRILETTKEQLANQKSALELASNNMRHLVNGQYFFQRVVGSLRDLLEAFDFVYSQYVSYSDYKDNSSHVVRLCTQAMNIIGALKLYIDSGVTNYNELVSRKRDLLLAELDERYLVQSKKAVSQLMENMLSNTTGLNDIIARAATRIDLLKQAAEKRNVVDEVN